MAAWGVRGQQVRACQLVLIPPTGWYGSRASRPCRSSRRRQKEKRGVSCLVILPDNGPFLDAFTDGLGCLARFTGGNGLMRWSRDLNPMRRSMRTNNPVSQAARRGRLAFCLGPIRGRGGRRQHCVDGRRCNVVWASICWARSAFANRLSCSGGGIALGPNPSRHLSIPCVASACVCAFMYCVNAPHAQRLRRDAGQMLSRTAQR